MFVRSLAIWDVRHQMNQLMLEKLRDLFRRKIGWYHQPTNYRDRWIRDCWLNLRSRDTR